MRSAASFLSRNAIKPFEIIIEASRGFTVAELKALIAFLEQLTGDDYEARGHGPSQILITANSLKRT